MQESKLTERLRFGNTTRIFILNMSIYIFCIYFYYLLFLTKLFTTYQAACYVTTHPYMVRRQLESQPETDPRVDQWEQTLLQSGELWLDTEAIIYMYRYACW